MCRSVSQNKTGKQLKTDACSVTAAKLVIGTGFITYALLGEKGIAPFLLMHLHSL